jgi:hypothetical protein
MVQSDGAMHMPPSTARRRKTARERREQKERAIARHVGFILKCATSVSTHRGSQPTQGLVSLAKTFQKDMSMAPSDVSHAAREPPGLHLETFDVTPLLFSSVPASSEPSAPSVPMSYADNVWEPLPVTRVARSLHHVLIIHVPDGISISKIPSLYADITGEVLQIPPPGVVARGMSGDPLIDLLEQYPKLFLLHKLSGGIHVVPFPVQ